MKNSLSGFSLTPVGSLRHQSILRVHKIGPEKY